MQPASIHRNSTTGTISCPGSSAEALRVGKKISKVDPADSLVRGSHLMDGCNAQVGTAALHPLGSCQAGWLLQDGTSKEEQFLAAITAPAPTSISHDHSFFFSSHLPRTLAEEHKPRRESRTGHVSPQRWEACLEVTRFLPS